MKTINIQLPTRLTKQIPFPGSGPPRGASLAKALFAGSGRRFWYACRSLRAALSGILDSSAYDHISLGREVSVAFTSQGPVVYRYGRYSLAEAVSAMRETDRKAQSVRKS